ncbi:hypothetical protein [Cellulomonas sp. KRMCY2]|uniref:hypothetical protein n=1 Tax=Cellulomonas sp. KRMCY2 TaxID=1304865 RepID=UPI00045EB1F6|nr:hypothetical protein [Cellulomonas sp. KRMCY2]
MTGAGVLGPLPGTNVLEAQRTMFGDLSDLPEGVLGMPSLVQLPQRGPGGDSVARTAALLTEMPVELGTHGWKLADRPGRDLERSRAMLREDVDTLAITGHDWTGPLVVAIRGPWTLAAILYLARGDRVLSDQGAVRELVSSLADGLGVYLAAVRASVPGAEITVVLREPMLPDVLGGAVASFAGNGRLRTVRGEDAAVALGEVVAAARAGGAHSVVAHGGARFASRSLRTLAASGADAVGVDAVAVRGPQWDQVAELVEGGQRIWFGLPQDRQGKPADVVALADLVSRPWTAVGLPAKGLDDVVVHVETSRSVAGGDLVLRKLQAVRTAMAATVRVAAELAERADAG